MVHFQGASTVVRGLFVALALVTLTSCGGPKEDDSAALGSGKLRWSSFPVTIQADSSLFDGGPAEEDLHAAISFWESRAGKTLFNLGSWPTGQAPYLGQVTNPQGLLANVIFFQNPWPDAGDWGTQIAGKTVINTRGDRITRAVVFLNGETQLCDETCDEGGGTSRRRLIAHELGHFLGFAHVQDATNIMYPTIQTGGSLDDETVDMGLLQRVTQ